jgi:hypothetical protein
MFNDATGTAVPNIHPPIKVIATCFCLNKGSYGFGMNLGQRQGRARGVYRCVVYSPINLH